MKIKGESRLPGDKSISHRAFMLGALARGTTAVLGPLESKDIESTRAALCAMGAVMEKRGDIWQVTGGGLKEPATVIDAGNSGTTARLMSGICVGVDGVTVMTGDSSLVNRPMARVIRPLQSMGASFLARRDRFLPMAVRGGNLTGISFDMDTASAQVKSALLLAGLKAQGLTTVREPSQSRDHSERMLAYLGAQISRGDRVVSIQGPQELQPRDIFVPGDPSSAAFPAVWAAAVPGSEVLLKDICINPTRTGFLTVLKRMGADAALENIREISGETVGDILVKGGPLKAVTIEGDEIPKLIDEIPILVIAACRAEGTTIIRGASELRVKETDRISALAQGFASLGARIEETDDGLVIDGPLHLRSGFVRTFGDHRIAMSFSILGRIADIGIRLDNYSCVDISFPGFFAAMEAFT